MKTCIVITKPKHIIQANRTAADLLELRTDLYENFSLTRLVKQFKKPIVVTIKNKNRQLLQEAIDLNVAYIDLDYQNKSLINYFKKNNNNKKTTLIISYHNFQSTPPLKKLQTLIESGVNKIATMINRIEDNWIIAQLLQQYPNRITAIGMGELGIMTRLHPCQRISYFKINFGRDALQCVSTEKKCVCAAPGQLSFNQRNLKLYGIIGNPVQHSLSPKLHNSWFKQNNISALYQRWETHDLPTMINIMRFFNLSGASVTMPYKGVETHDYASLLDRIDPIAKNIGAVNTIVRKGKKLIGYNTDWIGVNNAFDLSPQPSLLQRGRELNPLLCREGGRGKGQIVLRGRRILILGRGGAAQAVAYAMKQMGAKSIKMLSRNDKPDANFDILINATPVRDQLLIPKEWLHNKIVMDCNYGKPTKLVKTCRGMKDVIVLDGLPMLVNQAKEQFKLWMKA